MVKDSSWNFVDHHGGPKPKRIRPRVKWSGFHDFDVARKGKEHD